MENKTKIRVKEIKYTCPHCDRFHTIPVKGEWFYKRNHLCAYDGYTMDETFVIEEVKGGQDNQDTNNAFGRHH